MAAERARRLLSRSPEATRALGEALGRALPPGTVVALEGELGAGKTAFVQGLARGLGVRDPVTSPTYALMQSYQGDVDLHHFDAYMEGRERALLSDGGLEWLHAGGVAAIEWADRIADVLPEPRISVRMRHADASSRHLEIAVVGDPGGLDRVVRDLAPPPGVEEGA
jgi:tRNA threonylcarbamoyladenosine biosynthesis protein TsaE